MRLPVMYSQLGMSPGVQRRLVLHVPYETRSRDLDHTTAIHGNIGNFTILWPRIENITRCRTKLLYPGTP